MHYRSAGMAGMKTFALALQSIKATIDYLDGWGIKTYEFFLRTLSASVRKVYNGDMGGEFVSILSNLIEGQLTQAYDKAWQEEGDEGPRPEQLAESLDDLITMQREHIQGFYEAIIDARVDQTGIDPLLSRADQWAGQYDTAYRAALEVIRIAGGGNLIWKKGATEKGCETCARLNGLVLSAREWDELGLHPRGYPNPLLACGGGGPVNNCDCELVPTDKRRTANGYTLALDIIEGTRP